MIYRHFQESDLYYIIKNSLIIWPFIYIVDWKRIIIK